MKSNVRRVYVAVCIVIILLTLPASQCMRGIQSWLYSVGLYRNATFEDVRITMKQGWYPLSTLVVTSTDGLEFPSLVMSKVDGCRETNSLIFQKVAPRFLPGTDKLSQVSEHQYSWGAVEIVEFVPGAKQIPQKIAIVRKHGLLINISSPEILDEVVKIEFR